MKAIRVTEFGGAEVMKIEEIATPSPGAGEVVVRVGAAGINPVDVYIRSGLIPGHPLPYTPGRDAAGVVESVGAGVTSVTPESRVYTSGTISGAYAEFMLCRENQVHPLPENITFEQGAGVNVPYATGYSALFLRAKALPGETVLVHGATGGVGIASVQIAHAAGMRVIGTGGTEKGRELALREGADHMVDHHDPDYTKRIMELTDGRGVDVILEMAAHINLGRDLDLLTSFGGRVVVIGSRGPVQIDPRGTMGRYASIIGMMLMNAPEEEVRHIHPALVAGLRDGTLRPVIGGTFPLAEAARAHEEVMKPGAFGKIVLVP